MHIAFISLYDTGAAGLRALSSFIKSHGHRVSILFYGEMGRTHKEFHQFSKIEYAQSAVKWCDERDRQALIQTLKQLNPNLIGISLRSAFVQTAIELTQAIKGRFSVPILWGGIHPTLCPEESIQYADLLCRGEGEFPLVDLVNALDQNKDFSNIPNLWVKRKGEIIQNDLRPLNDLNAFPFSDYTEEDKYYFHSQPFNVKVYSIMTSRGCPFSCTFCCNSILRDIYKGKGKYIRRRSIDNVISELLLAKKNYDMNEVIFQDDVFVDEPQWLYPFLERYKKEIHLPFACFLHSQFVNEPLIKALKGAGLYTADLGIQSGSERFRKEIYHRRQTNEEIVQSAKLLNREIGMAYDLIIDNPFETEEELIETIHLLLDFPHPFRIHLLTLTFFPTYPLTMAAIEKGMIEKPNADVSVKEWLMIYKEERPAKIQSLYLLMAAIQHESVDKEFIRKALKDDVLLRDPKKLYQLLDRMIREESYVHDYRRREKPLEYLEGIKRVLLIPSGEVPTVSKVLQTIKEKYPDCSLSLLTGGFPPPYIAILPPEVIGPLADRERDHIDIILYHANNKMKLFGIDYAWIQQLRERKFHLTSLIHENEEGMGYIHIELLGLLIGAKHTLIYKPNQSFVELDRLTFLKTVIERKLKGGEKNAMSEAILLQGISKRYKMYGHPFNYLREAFTLFSKSFHKDFWALQEIDLKIHQGDTFGIIGENGAGKSTLLKIISGITQPDSGQIEVNGKIGALLELGSGFHQEYTGRENISLAGVLLGLSKREIQGKMEEVISFAGIGDFIDRPIKVYSTGMYLRLGFSVATMIDPDILITDEVLAVGDESFQKKCIKKMELFLKNGKTIIFCSHNLFQIKNICRKGIWLHQGKIMTAGQINHVVDDYLDFVKEKEEGRKNREKRVEFLSSSLYTVIKDLRILNQENVETENFRMGETVNVEILAETPPSFGESPSVGIAVLSQDQYPVYGISSDMEGIEPIQIDNNLYLARCQFLFPQLIPGKYIIRVHTLDHPGLRIFDSVEKTIRVKGETREEGIYRLPHRWLSKLES